MSEQEQSIRDEMGRLWGKIEALEANLSKLYDKLDALEDQLEEDE